MTSIATFTGTYTDSTVIAPGTDPWVEINSEPVDWLARDLPGDPNNDCEGCAGEVIPGVIAPMNSRGGIQRCDTCERFEGDLDAALALARMVGGVVRYVAVRVTRHVRLTGPGDSLRPDER